MATNYQEDSMQPAFDTEERLREKVSLAEENLRQAQYDLYIARKELKRFLKQEIEQKSCNGSDPVRVPPSPKYLPRNLKLSELMQLFPPSEEEIGEVRATLGYPNLSNHNSREKTSLFDADFSSNNLLQVSHPDCPNFSAVLPNSALVRVFQYLSNGDLVSAGQVCRQWRTQAKQKELWNLRDLNHSWETDDNFWEDSESLELDKGEIVRILRFAPCLRSLNVRHISDRGDKDLQEAIYETKCKVRGLYGMMFLWPFWPLAVVEKHSGHLDELEVDHVNLVDLLHLAFMEKLLLRVLKVQHFTGIQKENSIWLSSPDYELNAGFPEKIPDTTTMAFAKVQTSEAQQKEELKICLDQLLRLLRSQKNTLQELTLGSIGSSGMLDCLEVDLVSFLQQCELLVLQKLSLSRKGAKEYHSRQACSDQIARLVAFFGPKVTVECTQCSAYGTNSEACESDDTYYDDYFD